MRSILCCVDTRQRIHLCGRNMIIIIILISGPFCLPAQQARYYRTSISLNLTGLSNRVEVHGERRLEKYLAFGAFGAFYPFKYGYILGDEYSNAVQYENVILREGLSIAPYAKFFFAKEETDGFYARVMLQTGGYRYTQTTMYYDEGSQQYFTDSTQSSFLSFGGGAGFGLQYAIKQRLLIDLFIGLKINSLPASLRKYSEKWISLDAPGSLLNGCLNLGYCFK